jgi:hypothetical protein
MCEIRMGFEERYGGGAALGEVWWWTVVLMSEKKAEVVVVWKIQVDRTSGRGMVVAL